MAIMRWDPFGEMLRMQSEVDRIFSRLGAPAHPEMVGSVAWMPKIDVKSKGDDVTIHAELPGIDPADVDIDLSDNVLTIKGERKMEEEKEDEGWLIHESSFGSFERSVMLPEGVKPEDIKADYRDGVLEIHIPKALAEAKPKHTRIAITAGKKQ